MQYVQMINGKVSPINNKIVTHVGELPSVLLRNLSEDALKVLNVYKIQDEISYDSRTHIATDTKHSYDPSRDLVVKTATITKKAVADLRREVLNTSVLGEESGVVLELTKNHRKMSIVFSYKGQNSIICQNDASREQLLKNAELVALGEFPSVVTGHNEDGSEITEVLTYYPQMVLDVSLDGSTVEVQLDMTASEVTIAKVAYDTFQSDIDVAFGNFESALPTTVFNDIWPLVDAYTGTLPSSGDKYIETLRNIGV